MRLTILGGGGVWPTGRQACGGYLVEYDGFSLLIDPGDAVLPCLIARRDIGEVDAVLVSHGHLDHCADVASLLRARVLGRRELDPLPVFAPRDALTRLLGAERSRSVTAGADLGELGDGTELTLGPFQVTTTMLPHHLPNAGMRISAAGRVLAYTGDSGDCSDRADLAKGADLLLAEATYDEQVPDHEAAYLSSARQVARRALEGGVVDTVLTHRWPGEPAEHALAAARTEGLERVRVAFSGMTVKVPVPVAHAARARGGDGALDDPSTPHVVALHGRRAAAGPPPTGSILKADVPVVPRRARAAGG